MAASIGDLIISIAGDIAKFTESMTRAEFLAADTSKKIDKAMRQAGEAITAVGAGFLSLKTVEAFEKNVEGAIEAAAQLHKVAEQTGIAGEALSGLRSIAKLSATDLLEVATGVQRMSKNMVDAAAGGGKAADAFRAMHLSVRDSSGALKESDKFLLEVAKKLADMDNETQKVAYAMQIFGRSGAQLLPFLKDLAEAGEIQTKITRIQIQQAHDYEVATFKLAGVQRELWQAIAGQVTPVLTALVNTMITLRTGTGSLNETAKKLAGEQALRNWAIDAAIGVAALADKLIDFGKRVAIVFQTIGSALAVVGVFFAETFDNISFAIVHAGETLQSFGKVVLGASMMMAQNFVGGFAMVQDGMKGLSADATLYGDKLKSSWGHISDAAGGLLANLELSLAGFKQSNITGVLVDEFGKLATGVDKFTKKGAEHADVIQKVVHDAYDPLLERLVKVNAKLAEEIAFIQKHGYETHETQAAVMKAVLEEDKMVKVLTERAVREGTTVEALKARAMAEAEKADALTHTKDIELEYANLVKSENEQISQLLNTVKDQVATYGLAADAVTRYRIKLLELQKQEALLLDPNSAVAKGLQEQIDKLTDVAKWQTTLENVKNFTNAVMQAADWVGQIAVGFSQGWVHGIESARQILKQFLADLISITAKRWFLQLVASATSSTSIAAAAGQAGAGSVAGSVASAAGSYVSSGISGATVGGTVVGTAADFGAGWSAAQTGLALGEVEGATWLTSAGYAAGSIPVVGWVVAAVAAIAMLYDKYRDRENWQAQLGFGDQAQAYTSTGPFGQQGFNFIQGNDAVNRAIQGFMQGTTVLDTIIASTMSAETITRITQHLAETYGTRNDGQPATFAFGSSDTTAPEQLTLEFLQHKYGAIFDIVDKTFATWIRNYRGTAEDLWAAIIKEVQAMNSMQVQLSATGLHGLNLESMRQMAFEGESMQDTFGRVLKTWGDFVDHFSSDAQKLQTAQGDLAAFASDLADMGIQMPTDRAGWLSLAESLDLSSASGQELWYRMMALSPAFDLVTNTAAAAIARFNQLAGALSPAFGANNSRSVLESSVQAWMNLSPNNQNGWTVNSTIANIGSLISSGNIGAALTYAQSLGGNAVTVLNDMLTAYQTWIGATTTAGTAVAGAATAVGNAVSAVNTQVQSLMQQFEGPLSHVFNRTKPGGSDIEQAWARVQGASSAWTAFDTATGTHLSGEQILNMLIGGDEAGVRRFFAWAAEILGPDATTMLTNLVDSYGNFLDATDAASAAAAQLAQQLADAKGKLGEYVTSLATNTQLSPLGPMDRFYAAQGEYTRIRDMASGGDITAIGNLPNATNTYLDIARTIFGSGATYEAIYNSVRRELTDIATSKPADQIGAHLPDGTLASSNDIQTVRAAIHELITLLGQGLSTSDPEVAVLLRELIDSTRRTGDNGALGTGVVNLHLT